MCARWACLLLIDGTRALLLATLYLGGFLADPTKRVTIRSPAVNVRPSVPEVAVFVSLVIGECFGLLRLTLELVRAQTCEDADDCATLDTPLVTMNYLHFSLINTAVCWLVIAAITLTHNRRAGSHDMAPLVGNTDAASDQTDPTASTGGDPGSSAAAGPSAGEPAGLSTELLKSRRKAPASALKGWTPGLGGVLQHIAETAYREPDSAVLTLIVWVIMLVLYIFYA